MLKTDLRPCPQCKYFFQNHDVSTVPTIFDEKGEYWNCAQTFLLKSFVKLKAFDTITAALKKEIRNSGDSHVSHYVTKTAITTLSD